MSNPIKARTVEQTMSDFRRERPNEPQSLYDLVRKYIINARSEVTLEKVTQQIEKRNAAFFHPCADDE